MTQPLETGTFRFAPLYSGGTLCVANNDLLVVLDIDGIALEETEAELRHDGETVPGRLTRVWVDKNPDGTPAVFAEGRFHTDAEGRPTTDAREVTGPAKIHGKKWECSIHIHPVPAQDIEYIAPGQKVEINGKPFVGPLKRIRRSRLKEGSFVDMGGDAFNHVEIAAGSGIEQPVQDTLTFSGDEIAASLSPTNHHSQNPNPEKGNPMSQELKDYIVALGFNPEELTADQIGLLERAMKDKMEALAPPPTETAAENPETPEKKPDGVAAENPEAPEKKPDGAAADAAQPPAEDPNKDKEHEVAANHSYFKRPNPAQNLPSGRTEGVQGTPNINRAWEVALLGATGFFKTDDEIQASGKFNDNEMTEGLSRRARNPSFKKMFAEAHERRTGIRTDGTEPEFASGVISRLNNPHEIYASIAFSTMNELTIMQNVLNKIYKNGYESFTSVIEKICSVSSTDNFYSNKYVTYDIVGGSQEIPEGHEIPNVTLDSEELENQLEEHGFILTITERMIINDNTGAIAKLFRKMGLKEKRTRELRGFKKLLENIDELFGPASADGSRGANIVNLPLSIEGLNKASQLLAEMPTIGSTEDEPEFTEEAGKYLLVPKALVATAQTLFRDTKCDLIGLEKGELQTNPHVGEYEPIATSYMGSKLAKFGGSDLHAILLGDPINAALMDIVYLNGESGPRLEEVATPGNKIGKSFRSIYRYGFGLGDYRAGVLLTGTDG